MEMYYKPVRLEAADVVHFGLVVFFSTTTRTFDALAHYHIRFPFIYSSAYSSCNINEANMIRLLVLRLEDDRKYYGICHHEVLLTGGKSNLATSTRPQ